MKGWRKSLLLSLIVVLAVGIVAACSGSNGGGGSKPNESGSEHTGGGDNNGEEKYTITVLDYRYGQLPPMDGQGVKMINEKFNVDYRPTYVSVNDYMQKVSVTVAGGDMPDILILENPMDPLYYKWAEQGAFLPLTEYLDEYESFKLIPDYVREGLRVNGEIYGIPGYTTSVYSITPMIRVDWLENLGLDMPTNYDELRKVALAFTHDDPDQNDKHDTYGMAMAENINPQYHLGAYWDFLAWYHQDEEGNYIPGIISEVRKNHIEWLKDLYAEGAITPDFALINWGQAYREFFGGKAGMFITTPKGIGNDNITALLDIHPEAKLAPIPPFVDPDGNQGFTATEGTLRLIMLNEELKDQPGKVKRIMEMIDYGRKFITPEEAGPDNEDYDWLYGREGSGYTMVDGTPVVEAGEKGLKPRDYLPDLAGWAPNDAANQYPDQYKNVPLHYELTRLSAEMHDTTKHYYGPTLSLYTPAKQENELNLYFLMYEEQTRMITGQTPIEQWDEMVQKYMDEGGAQMIAEVNAKIKEVGAKPEWR